MLADEIHPLAHGHHALPSRVEHEAPAEGADGGTLVVPVVDARNRRIGLRKDKYAPVGQDPNQCILEARRVSDVTLQDVDL